MAKKRPELGNGLFYTRDSGGEHENTPGEYVRWAQRRAARLGVKFEATPARLEAMIRDGRSVDGELFLDYGVKGNLLKRPGLDALFEKALTDHSVTHVFIPRRDRFARPDDPLDAMKLESNLREAGLTLVFMERTMEPVAKRGRRDLGESIVAMIDYDRAGMERRDLAQKMIYAQLNLAKGGYSTGGRPPFGFRRWLVRADGTAERQLADGESVKMAGRHVVWLPGPEEERALIRRILEMLETMPACRVAATLTAEGVPPPDANRLRTDRGVKHRTSGVWHQTTVTNIARNPLLRATVEYGRRSMGDKLRFMPEGPRELDDDDHRRDGKPKVVANPASARISAPARFEPLVDPDRHRRLLKSLEERGGRQRGKPRSQDPTRNPLGGRVFDMSCGWLMYRQPYKESFRYKCGLYQQSQGARCKHNHVDGMAAVQFLMGCIRQRLSTDSARQKLERKLRSIAERELGKGQADAILNSKRTELAELKLRRERVQNNMALADGEDQFRAVAGMFGQLMIQEKLLQAEIDELERSAAQVRHVDEEVGAALAVLDGWTEAAAGANDMAKFGELFRELNVRLFLRFAESSWKTRVVNKLVGGVVTFGETEPPRRLYEGPRERLDEKSPPLSVESDGPNSRESPRSPEGAKMTLRIVDRGDRI